MKKLFLIICLAASLMLPAAAIAQNGYSGVAGAGGGGAGSEPASAVAGASDGVGSLPFTGLEVGVIAGAGLLLLGTGFVLRRTRTN